MPSGNGTIGAAVYGAVHEERVLLTHEYLWGGVKTPPLPDISGSLPEVRRLLFDGRAELADRVLADELERLGYAPEIGTPLPLGDLMIRMPVMQGFREYRRELDMETGEVLVSWRDNGVSYCRKLFVSRADDLVVMKIASSDGPLTAEISLGLHDPTDARQCLNGAVPLPEMAETVQEGRWITYAARNDDGKDFGAVARVVRDEQQALVVVKLFACGERQGDWERLRGELSAVEMDYDALLAPHAALHRELFLRVTLDLGVSDEDAARSNEELLLEAYRGEAPLAMIEKMWAYGRYLLICSSRPGGLPCPLLGKWCGEYRGFWAFHMANENLQMIYWQALPGALPETLLPVFDYFDGKLDDFRENARRIYGCGGIYIPAVTTPPSGLLKNIQPHIIHWTGAAAWIGQHYYDYYLHTGDERFLRERALPFLRETIQFYEDFFTVGDDGYFVSAPSNSPENNPAEYWDGQGMGEKMETTINATMDFALAKEALANLICGAEHTGLYSGDLEKWRGMLRRIPPYQINGDGAVREWMHPFFSDNYHHRHQSHIYPVFPGTEVTRESDPDLFAAFETAIQKRLQIGISEQTGWSLAHMAHVFARMADGCSALECLNLLARACVKNNFYTTHNDWRGMGIGLEMEWAPFQIDANMGWTSAIQEMLLFSLPGRISILPALPTAWTRGAVSGLVARGGVQVSIQWDPDTVGVELKAQRDQMIELTFTGGVRRTIHLKAGVPSRFRR